MQPTEYGSGGDVTVPQENLQYADDTDATDIVVGRDYDNAHASRDGLVYMDDKFESGSGEDAGYKIPIGSWDNTRPDIGSGGEDNFVAAYASCRWLRHAAVGEMPGDSCARHYKGYMQYGFIFRSLKGSLECGYLIATAADSEGLVNKKLYAAEQYACPQGIDADTLDHDDEFKDVMPYAGCLNSNDANYDPRAQVHTPAACHSNFESIDEGCMLPLAENYNASALTPGYCSWRTFGCMDSTAHNYNPEATDNDDSCIERVVGCNLPGTELKDPATSDYDTPTDVTTMICEIRVVGCMTPTAPNYYEFANVPGNCGTSVEGCMLGSNYSFNFDAGATVSTGCQIKHPGCTDPSAHNYHPSYNVDDGSCIPKLAGCKNKESINYDASATVHVPYLCMFAQFSPPPPPGVPGSVVEQKYPILVSAELTVSFTCADTDMAEKTVAAYAAEAGASTFALNRCIDGAVSGRRRLQAGNIVNLDMKLTYTTQADQAAGKVAASLVTSLEVEGAALAVSNVGIVDLPVESIIIEPLDSPPPSSPPDAPPLPPAPPPAPSMPPSAGLGLGAIIGIAVGAGVVVIGVIVVVVFLALRKKNKTPVANA